MKTHLIINDSELLTERQKMKGRVVAVLALLLLSFAAQFSLVGLDDWFTVGLNMIELTSPSQALPSDMPVVGDNVSSVLTLGWKIPQLIELIISIVKEIFSLLF